MVIRKSKFVAKTEFIDQSYVFKIYCLLFYHRFYRTYKQTHKHPNVTSFYVENTKSLDISFEVL